jgi:hypothetical protein
VKVFIFGDNVRKTGDTKVQISYDEKWLYFGFECANKEPEYYRNAEKDHDGKVAQDDSIEILISSENEQGGYYHFMLNCENVKAEQKVVGVARDRSWNPPWLSSVSRKKDGGALKWQFR